MVAQKTMTPALITLDKLLADGKKLRAKREAELEQQKSLRVVQASAEWSQLRSGASEMLGELAALLPTEVPAAFLALDPGTAVFPCKIRPFSAGAILVPFFRAEDKWFFPGGPVVVSIKYQFVPGASQPISMVRVKVPTLAEGVEMCARQTEQWLAIERTIYSDDTAF